MQMSVHRRPMLCTSPCRGTWQGRKAALGRRPNNPFSPPYPSLHPFRLRHAPGLCATVTSAVSGMRMTPSSPAWVASNGARRAWRRSRSPASRAA